MAQRQDTSRRNLSDTQTVSRRNDVIRCEICGEDYATTYKRCPFCDGRSGGAVTGRRAARNTRGGGYGGPVSPLQIVYVVVSLILIIAALYIVFSKVGPLLFPKDPGSSSSSVSSSQSGTPSGNSSADVSQPGSSSGDSSTGDVSTPPVVMVEAISLSRTDFTLNPSERYQILVAVSPSTVTEPVKWSSSDTSLATVDENGWVVNVNTTGEKKKVVITATCGDREATCDVYCKSNAAPQQPSTGGQGDGAVVGQTGTVVNAGGGLNIRSGPGSNYEKIASTSNGAKVTILEDCGNGWYKIDYGNGKVGYVSADFISVK